MPSSNDPKFHEQYDIQQSDRRKYMAIAPSPYVFKISNACSWSLWTSYICFQCFCVSVNCGIFSKWRVYASILAEVLISLPEMLFLLGTTFTVWKLPKSSEARRSYYLNGDAAPTVDIFVTCAGEPVNTVMDTVKAAVAQDYPTTKFRLLLLDDGNDPNLRYVFDKLSEELITKTSPAVQYLARPPDDHNFGKAGNLQYGIEWTREQGSSEFIASLDADMITEPDWLRRLVPHALVDGGVGLVNPPQVYYNIPEDDPLGNEADLVSQYSVYEPLNDQLGAAICTGTGFVARRKALEEIGGWPLIVPCDDIMCSTLLNKNGWKVAYVQENVQVGLGPDSWEAFLKQKMRWKTGMLIYIKSFNFFSPDTDLLKMTWFQSAAGFIQSLGCYIPILFIVATLLLPLAVWPASRHLENEAPHSCIHLIKWLFLAAYIAQKINLYIVYRHCGLKTARTLKLMSIWISPFETYVCLKSLLPSDYSKHQALGSISSHLNERSKSRASLFHRVTSPSVAFYFIYAPLATAPLLLQLFRREDSAFLAFPGPLIKLLECIMAALVPISYMIFPPTMPPREDMLETDAGGVRRPKRREKKPDNRVSYVDALEFLIIAWCFGRI